MPKKVYINVCSRRSPEWGMSLKLQKAMHYAGQKGISCTLSPRVGESLICRARNNTLIAFMETDCDWLMTVDDDIELPEDAIIKLIEDKKDIVGGVYRLKEGAANTATRWLPGQKDLPGVLKRGDMVKVVYISTGCMLVRRTVVEVMIAAYPDLHYVQNVSHKPAWALYQPYIHNTEYLSEDWAFCQRAKDVGFDIWCDASIKCAHWGLIRYDFEEAA